MAHTGLGESHRGHCLLTTAGKHRPLVPALQEPNSDNNPHSEGTSQLYLRLDVSQASEPDSFDCKTVVVTC